MLFGPPSHDVLYKALLSRDPTYEGRAFVGVLSTGVFCRLTCPARKPKREHCRFFETAAECLEAGFRACLRCHPLQPAVDADPTIRALLPALNAEPRRRWSEADLAALGFEPSTVRRAFKRHLGMTFLELARLYRIRGGMESLSAGARVIDAQLEAGFDSPSGFRDAFARLLGQSPAAFTGDEQLKADGIDTPLGPMIAVSDERCLHLLEFMDRRALAGELDKLRTAGRGPLGLGRHEPTERIEAELRAYFNAESARFDTPLALHGGPFARAVWAELCRIPPGETRSYGDIARSLGRSSATRAVARANGANQLAIVIPCHRVIGADGSLTGYGGGLWRKQKLIDIEQRFHRRTSA